MKSSMFCRMLPGLRHWLLPSQEFLTSKCYSDLHRLRLALAVRTVEGIICNSYTRGFREEEWEAALKIQAVLSWVRSKVPLASVHLAWGHSGGWHCHADIWIFAKLWQTIICEGKMSDITETVKSKTQKEVVPPNAQYLSSAGGYWKMEILLFQTTGSALGTAAVWRQEWAIPSLACPEMQPRQNGAMQMPTCFLLLCNCHERSVAVPTNCVPKMSRSKGKPLSCCFWPCALQIKLQSSSLVCCKCQLCYKTCFLK